MKNVLRGTKALPGLTMLVLLTGCATHYSPVVPVPVTPVVRAADPAPPLPPRPAPTPTGPVSPATNLAAVPIAPTLPPAPVVRTLEPPPVAPIPIQPSLAPMPVVPPPPVDQVAMLREWVALQERLYRVAAPLLINNTELCPDHARNILGLTAKTRYSYSEGFVAEAQSLLGLGERLRIMNVLPGSGAAQAGLQKGDLLVKANIEDLPDGADAERAGASLIASEMRGRASLSLTILRDDTRMQFDVPLTQACAMVIDLGNSDRVNSYADGHRIMVTRGMIGFVQSDEELAYVLAREMAHNVLSPSSRPDIGAVIDQLHTLKTAPIPADIDAALPPFTPVLDATADKLALYMLVRAEYGIGDAIPFWKRLAAAYPAEAKGNHTALHPATKYRLSVMDQITKTIDAKRKNNLALVP